MVELIKNIQEVEILRPEGETSDERSFWLRAYNVALIMGIDDPRKYATDRLERQRTFINQEHDRA